MNMLSHIKDVIGDKAIVSTEPFGVDEERQLIAFEVNDLAAVLRDVIQTCADCCEIYVTTLVLRQNRRTQIYICQ
jgi:hypothetical protein